MHKYCNAELKALIQSNRLPVNEHRHRMEKGVECAGTYDARRAAHAAAVLTAPQSKFSFSETADPLLFVTIFSFTFYVTTVCICLQEAVCAPQ